MSESHANTAQEVRFRYFRSPDYRVMHADGFRGGWNVQGQLVMDGFVERPAMPDETVLSVKTGEERAVDPPTSVEIERDLLGGFAVPHSAVVALHAWLGARLVEYDEARTRGQK